MTTSSATADIRESHTEQLIGLQDSATITDGVLALAERDPSCRVYAVRNGAGGWVDVTVTQFLAEVRAVAKGLIGLGVEPGDRVAVMARTSYGWAAVDQAIWFAGGVSVPIYETSSSHQVAHLLADSGAQVVLAGDEQLASRAMAGANMSFGRDSSVQILPIGSAAERESLAARGAEVTDHQLEQARTSAAADDVATLVYTSGTTGRPKGAQITHRNLAEGGANILSFAEDILGDGESRTLLFLPLAHVLARAVQLMCLQRGIQVAHSSDTSTLLQDLASFRPTWLLAVPRVMEKVYQAAASAAEAKGAGRIFEAARRTAVQYSQAVEAAQSGTGSGPSALLRARHAAFSRVVYSTLREKLGGQVSHIVSGASPLNPELGHFFTGAGLPIQEGYGLTETTAPITLNIPGATRIGSVGLPVPGCTVRIASDGEILLKGPVVFAGYHHNDDASQDVFDAEGFFRSGDLGSLDEDGFLRITGRKKELIVTAGGKNVSPAPLEEAVRSHRLVSQVVVLGDNRPFVSALIFPDAEQLAGWAQERGLGRLSLTELLQDREAARALRAELQAAVDAANTEVSRAESIRAFEVLDAELTESSGHLTPSMKLIRHAVLEDFADAAERIYAP
ncbi:long-chain fatty acid--CoA ligase [Nesterenkonia sp.]|uniref:AMP-dependent synthetase/ligase n=1 Tax=Nesterenkonia sp. TaxID=704201 RepID=UPI0026105D66|nr:AMP-dependent synthetase/ligase [Nesterenkonia sp.]